MLIKTFLTALTAFVVSAAPQQPAPAAADFCCCGAACSCADCDCLPGACACDDDCCTSCASACCAH